METAVCAEARDCKMNCVQSCLERGRSERLGGIPGAGCRRGGLDYERWIRRRLEKKNGVAIDRKLHACADRIADENFAECGVEIMHLVVRQIRKKLSKVIFGERNGIYHFRGRRRGYSR